MRILIVEDEQRIARTLKKGLELEKYAVDISFDGSEGFSLASTEAYDVIVLDLMLPEISGVEICQKLREKKINTPILMLTAKSQIQDKVSGLNAGADDYLTKPFSFEELLARIRALSRRPKHSLATILTVGELSLDTNTYIVKRAEQQLSLSSKEFALTEYLMRNEGKILTKDQIIQHVWDYDADILPNTVEVYIRNLRKKIDDPFKDKVPLIQTIRGFGYRLGE
ncbi:MAG: response regulator transcription factor [Patescibacteria group bacterium]